MIELNSKSCKLITGASTLSVFPDGNVHIHYIEEHEIFTLNNMQFTRHGIFDMQNKPYFFGDDLPFTYDVECFGTFDDEVGWMDISSYRLTPI